MEPELSLLKLRAEPWGGFQLRNVHKTNVGWSSYPFLPPTTADGLLASIVEGERWVEGNFHPPRSLRSLDGFDGISVLGAYPSDGRHTRAHFRSHVGTLMSYDGPLWVPPELPAGKKPAMVEDYLCNELGFVVVGKRESLEILWESVNGQIAPFAKKSILYFRYEESPTVETLRLENAASDTYSLTALPMVEIGSMPKRANPYLMPVKSCATQNNSGRYEVTWSHLNCIWEPGLRIRQGTQALISEDGLAISKNLFEAVRDE